MSPAPRRVLVLGSGRGTNFEALADAADKHWRIVAVGSDRPDAPLLDRARRRDIEAFSVPPGSYPNRPAHDRALADAIARYRPDMIALAGYMRILGESVVETWRGRMLNIHPSLLPAFPGLNTHARALEAGAAMHGATVHFVTPELDAGPRIVQGRTAVDRSDTVESLRRRVQALEHRIYPLAVAWLASGRLTMVAENAWLDGRMLKEPVVIEERSCA